MKKKIISAILCVVLAAVSVVSSSAVSTGNDDLSSGLTLDDFLHNARVLSVTTLPNKAATFFTYGPGIDPTSGVILEYAGTSQTALSYKFNTSAPNGVTKSLPSSNGYTLSTCLHNGSGSGGRVLNFCNGGGKYEKMRIKLSAFSDYFNSDGTTTHTFGKDTHDYNYTKEPTGGYTSSLIFFSGNAITAAAPDRDGRVEIYVSTKLGERTFFTTDFEKDTPSSYSGGGGTSGSTLKGFTVGDVDKNGSLNLGDGIATLKSNTKIITLDELATRNADANRDGEVNLKDAIAIQKYNISH